MSNNKCEKRKKNAISFADKLHIIKQRESGKSFAAISRETNRPESTIRTIINTKDRFLETVKESVSMERTIITQNQDSTVMKMEKLLILWIEDLTSKRIPLNMKNIQEKALSLYKDLKSETGTASESDLSFKASNGWFIRFKKRENLRNVKIYGETNSADDNAAMAFPDIFAKLVETNGYRPEQIFNVDETALFWKKIPTRSYICKQMDSMPGYKVAKDRLTVMVGGNLAGKKLKPLVVYRAQKPRAFKNVNVDSLPVTWKFNTKGWVTRTIFKEWFEESFVPEVQKYCQRIGIPFKILLLLDNAPGHPVELENMHPNVHVLFLPPRTTALLQPMDQGVIAAFKSHYIRVTFRQAIKSIENEHNTLSEFWKKYNVLNAVNNIAVAWQEVKKETLQAAWKKIYQQQEEQSEVETLSESIDEGVNECLSLAHFLQIEVDFSEMKRMITSAGEPLTNDDLIKLQTLEVLNEYFDEDDDEVEDVGKKFTVKGLAEAFSHIEKALAAIEVMDDNEERFEGISSNIRAEMEVYKKIMNEMKNSTKQLTMDSFVYKA